MLFACWLFLLLLQVIEAFTAVVISAYFVSVVHVTSTFTASAFTDKGSYSHNSGKDLCPARHCSFMEHLSVVLLLFKNTPLCPNSPPLSPLPLNS